MTLYVHFPYQRARSLDRLEALTHALYREEIIDQFKNGNKSHTEWYEATKREAGQTGQSVTELRDQLWSWVGMFHKYINHHEPGCTAEDPCCYVEPTAQELGAHTMGAV